MEGSIGLSQEERKALLRMVRNGGSVRVARRGHIILLLADGWSYRQIRDVMYCSFDLIAECVDRFRRRGLDGLRDAPATTEAVSPWLALIEEWVLTRTPRDFGYFRSRWSCDTLAEVLAWETGLRFSRETIRRGLLRLTFVWRRPRPVVGPEDPEYNEKLARIRQLLADLPPDETAVFQDEVDVHLNPKIGACWTPQGIQSEVVTPGNNQKRHIAGSLHWRTGTLVASAPGTRRNADLFIAHLEDLRRSLRGYHKIHVICDNAPFHDCRKVREYLRQWGHRIKLHFLPKYAPETNPIERVWWRMHETITRNHRCQSLDELLTEVYHWFTNARSFYTATLAQYAMAA